jgi:hypothetical protein
MIKQSTTAAYKAGTWARSSQRCTRHTSCLRDSSPAPSCHSWQCSCAPGTKTHGNPCCTGCMSWQMCSVTAHLNRSARCTCLQHLSPASDRAPYKHGWHVEPKYPVLHCRHVLPLMQLAWSLVSQCAMHVSAICEYDQAISTAAYMAGTWARSSQRCTRHTSCRGGSWLGYCCHSWQCTYLGERMSLDV